MQVHAFLAALAVAVGLAAMPRLPVAAPAAEMPMQPAGIQTQSASSQGGTAPASPAPSPSAVSPPAATPPAATPAAAPPAASGSPAGAAAETPASPAAPPPGPPPPRRLTIVSRYEGEWLAALRGIYVVAYTAATGLPADVEAWEGGTDTLRARLKGGAWDLVQLSADELAAACEDSLLEKIDWTTIGGRDHYQQAGTADCGVAASARSLVLAWDRDKIPGNPTWADFFDIARYPGKRALPRRARDVLELALMADGVAPGDVYRTLRSADGVDRAFRKLDQLRPYIDWWASGADATRALGSGEVLMTAAPNGSVVAADRAGGHHFGMQWAGAITSFDWWAIPRNSPAARQAQQFVYLAGLPAMEARMLAEAGAPGLAKGVADFAAPAVQAQSPLQPANASVSLMADEAFWRDSQDKLASRFNTWLGH